MNHVPAFLTRLGGGDPRTLEKVPSATPAFQQMAGALLFTSCMAVVSMWFALTDAVHAPVLVAFVLAVFWGAGILVLDRTLMVLGMGGGRVGSVTVAATRLLAALLIGVVVSTPLTLRIFASDINFQLGQMHLAQGKTNQAAERTSPQRQQLNQVEHQLADWQDIEAGNLPQSFAAGHSAVLRPLTGRLHRLLAQEATAQHSADQAAILYNCERYGGGRAQLDDPSKCAREPGPFGNAPLYHREALAAAARLRAVQASVATARHAVSSAEGTQRQNEQNKLTELRREAPQRVADLQVEVTKAQAAYDALAKNLGDENNGNNGLLAQLTALWIVGEQHHGLLVAHALLGALFVLVELLPVLSKLVWQLGRNGRAYEEAAASNDEVGLAEVQTTRARAQIEAETAFDAALLAKEEQLDHQRAEIAHRLELLRVHHQAQLSRERARAEELATRRANIDAEFDDRRDAQHRRQAEEACLAREAEQASGTVHFADFTPPASEPRRRRPARRRQQ